ncbi:phage tail protein [Escherichia coli]|uniref:phage tail-collar fiber domain-containing protein n=1 Tax=Escherichia TaxID=561 RepID=UPI000BE5BFFF|nr:MULTISPECIES: phage tail protein [Escherichia]MCX1465989.1 phage tail protein [Escherichia coli]MEC9495918.1 phage tail protein [Escherichia whittamii]MEC9561552.1 phage tail protein [Escherichia whittamii]GCM64654.1 phage tail fiber protein [Escherichia coli]HAN9558309.1 phage tail protein [Escherichia coli]
MTVKYYAILTNQGAARLANATMLGSKLNLTQMAVGDANGVLPTPDPAQTKLINQKRIAPLNLLSIDPNNQNQIIAEQIIPENEGGFWIREIGLYDDEGVLIAVANCPETYKPQLQEGSGRTQTIRMILVVTNTEAITLKIDPSVVLATRKYVDDKISEHEQSRRHPDASLTAKGFTQLSSAINSESETLAATPKAVKTAYDLADGKYTAQNATTTQKGIVQLSSATNSTSETLAATTKAVKAAYDLANGKYTAQDATTARKGIVQLSSATNSTSETLAATTKAVKTVMDEANKKAPLNSPALTGTPTTPTAPKGTNNTQIASTAYVMDAITALVDSSPDALNTLNELAEALGNDPNFATTMTNALAGKQPKDATLTALAGLATAADKLPYFTGADRAALTALTSVGRAIIGKTSTQGVLDYLGLGGGSALPVGVPVPWPSATPPTGWLKCNGAAFDKVKYPTLAKAYPSGKLPDLRGEFIRGWDDGRGVDSGRSLLSSQDATFIRTALQDYYGVDTTTSVKVGIAFASADKVQTSGIPANSKAGDSSNYVPASSDNSITGTQRTAEDGFNGAWISVRPRNTSFNYIVRAA